MGAPLPDESTSRSVMPRLTISVSFRRKPESIASGGRALSQLQQHPCLWVPAFAAIGFTHVQTYLSLADSPKRTETCMDLSFSRGHAAASGQVSGRRPSH